MAWWKFINPANALEAVRFGSRWSREGRRTRKAYRRALRWRLDQLEGREYVPGTEVSERTRKQYIIDYGQGRTDAVLTLYREYLSKRDQELERLRELEGVEV